jgi:crotonobetainyl-CoA:carnitine CoA-transferase CaiB-like acyl-CoA transferase
MASLPYQDLRVLDLSQGVAGPYCAGLLAQQGADVVKIEPPEGDWARTTGGGDDGMTPLVIACNLNKRSAVIDARKPEGRTLLAKLAAKADVLLQNFRPGASERMGVGYDSVSRTNRGVIYLSITGFGADGPEAGRAGTDSVLQSYTGLAQLNRNADGSPRRVPLLVPDLTTGLYASQAIGAALFARSHSGEGRHIRVSLLESCAAIQASHILEDTLFHGRTPPPNTIPGGMFRTSDGWLFVGAVGEPMFASLMRVLGLERWLEDERFASFAERQKNAQIVNDAVAQKLVGEPAAVWLQRFAQADVLSAEPVGYAQFRQAPQVRHVGAFTDLDQPPYGMLPLPRIPGADRGWPMRPAPRKGEHTREVLHELGLQNAEIDALAAQAVVAG